MDKKTFNELLDALLENPDDMGYGIHSELVMNAYVDTLTGFGEFLWWNLCFSESEPVYSCPISPDATMRPSPGVCMGSMAVFHTAEDMAIKEKLRQKSGRL